MAVLGGVGWVFLLGGCILTYDKIRNWRDDTGDSGDARLAYQAEGRFEWIPIAGGPFDMGCTPGQSTACAPDEDPVHRVVVGDFDMAATEVTRAQWAFVMLEGFDGDPQLPVTGVSWARATEFAWRLSDLMEVDGCYDIDADANVVPLDTAAKGCVRLPTEAEWEYAARSGRDTLYAGSANDWEVAVANRGAHHAQVVGTLAPNASGLYDMSGNVAEWTADPYAPYPAGTTGPADEAAADLVVIRGGAWTDPLARVRVSARAAGARDAAEGYPDVGLRVVRTN